MSEFFDAMATMRRRAKFLESSEKKMLRWGCAVFEMANNRGTVLLGMFWSVIHDSLICFAGGDDGEKKMFFLGV